MGSGDRFTCGNSNGFGLGFYYTKFPFAHTISINFLFWYISIGIGKAYDDFS